MNTQNDALLTGLKWALAGLAFAAVVLVWATANGQTPAPPPVALDGASDPWTMLVVFVLAPVAAQATSAFWMHVRYNKKEIEARDKRIADLEAQLRDRDRG